MQCEESTVYPYNHKCWVYSIEDNRGLSLSPSPPPNKCCMSGGGALGMCQDASELVNLLFSTPTPRVQHSMITKPEVSNASRCLHKTMNIPSISKLQISFQCEENTAYDSRIIDRDSFGCSHSVQNKFMAISNIVFVIV